MRCALTAGHDMRSSRRKSVPKNSEQSDAGSIGDRDRLIGLGDRLVVPALEGGRGCAKVGPPVGSDCKPES